MALSWAFYPFFFGGRQSLQRLKNWRTLPRLSGLFFSPLYPMICFFCTTGVDSTSPPRGKPGEPGVCGPAFAGFHGGAMHFAFSPIHKTSIEKVPN